MGTSQKIWFIETSFKHSVLLILRFLRFLFFRIYFVGHIVKFIVGLSNSTHALEFKF